MTRDQLIIFGIPLAIIACVLTIIILEFITLLIGDFFESLYDAKERKRNQEPKKVYPPKKPEVQQLIKEGKANIVSAPHLIEDNLAIKSRLKFKNHEEKCEFLKLCDIVEQRDGFITDFEVVNLLAVTDKIKI